MASKVKEYLEKFSRNPSDNANTTFSHTGLMHAVGSECVREYWLKEVYDERVRKAVAANELYIHDMGCLSSYCSGWNIADVLEEGFGGVQNKIKCKPPKHFATALNQLVDFLFTLQGELAGAQALSNFDTYLAPFVRYDGLTEREVFKSIQTFVFSLNVPTRSGFQTPFTNISMDISCPQSMAGTPVLIGGVRHKNWTYDEFQVEMDTINRAFSAVMCAGDGAGNIFSFPIPTYNIREEFDFDDPRHVPLWEMTAKYGVPYFANFVNSDLNPDDYRSMCCRLRLDVRKLQVRGGGLFGATPLTGSVGVVTINVPNLALQVVSADADSSSNSAIDMTARRAARDAALRELLINVMRSAKIALETKRAVVEENHKLYPYASHYLKSIKERSGKFWTNHFSTIGVVGAHEACRILFGTGIETEGDWALSLLELAKTELQRFQEETGNIYNLEATPAESASSSLAKRDAELFPKAAEAGLVPEYYTNSTALPVNSTPDIFKALAHQVPLHGAYTGGTVFHAYLGELLPSWKHARDLVRLITTNYKIPYLSITPTFSVCQNHGYICGEHEVCPHCGEKSLVYSRIVGYYRPVSDWNNGKRSERSERVYYKVDDLGLGGDCASATISAAITVGAASPPDKNASDDIASIDEYCSGVSIIAAERTYNDIPGKASAITVFLGGCNFSCPWCHNVEPATSGAAHMGNIRVSDVLKMVLDSPEKNLVVTGGEPTARGLDALKRLLTIFKEHSVFIKLDTNGSNPKVLAGIIKSHLVDFVAIDLKNSPHKYALSAGISPDTALSTCENVIESIRILVENDIQHQVRTTVVPGLVDVEDVVSMRALVAGAGSDPFALCLQRFRKRPKLVGGASAPTIEHSSKEFEDFTAAVEARTKASPAVDPRNAV